MADAGVWDASVYKEGEFLNDSPPDGWCVRLVLGRSYGLAAAWTFRFKDAFRLTQPATRPADGGAPGRQD